MRKHEQASPRERKRTARGRGNTQGEILQHWLPVWSYFTVTLFLDPQNSETHLFTPDLVSPDWSRLQKSLAPSLELPASSELSTCPIRVLIPLETRLKGDVNIQATLLNKQVFQGDYLLLFMMTDHPSDFPQHMSPEEIRYSTFLKQGQEKMFL